MDQPYGFKTIWTGHQAWCSQNAKSVRVMAASMLTTNCWSFTARYWVAANLQSCQSLLLASGFPVSSSSLGFDTRPVALLCFISARAAVAASAAAVAVWSAPWSATTPGPLAWGVAMVAYSLSSRIAAGISPGQLRYHERFCESLGATAAVVLGSLFSLWRKAHCVLPCWKKRCRPLGSWEIQSIQRKGCRDIGYDMMHVLHQILTLTISMICTTQPCIYQPSLETFGATLTPSEPTRWLLPAAVAMINFQESKSSVMDIGWDLEDLPIIQSSRDQ